MKVGLNFPERLDAHVREELEQLISALQADPITSLKINKGDLIYGSETGVWLPLADVAAGSYLRSGGIGAVPLWSTVTLPNTAAQGDLLYGSATNVLTALAKDANATRSLTNTGASNAPAWAQVVLTSGVSGTLPVANGGTGVATVATDNLLTGNGTSALTAESTLTYNGTTLTLGSGQIAFPATQNASAGANTLDDYEEGTVTIGISFGGGTTGITYSTQSLEYVKIGKRITFSGRITLTSKGSSVGNAVVTGLPFTSDSTYLGYTYGGFHAAMLGIVGSVGGYITVSATTIQLTTGGPTDSANLIDTNFTNTSDFLLAGIYLAG